MAPADAPKGLGDNTYAEMEAGKKNLAQYFKRDDDEHEAGRQAVQRHAEKTNPRG